MLHALTPLLEDETNAVISTGFETLSRWRWTPPDESTWAVGSSFSATVDPATVGEVRFRAVNASTGAEVAVTSPVTVFEPVSRHLNQYLEVGAGAVIVEVQARRIEGTGSTRVLEPSTFALPSALANGVPGGQTPSAPVVMSARIAGSPYVGETLTAEVSVSGVPQPTTSYQWHRNGVPITGATARHYLVPQADVGALLSFAVRAVSTSGVASASSDTVGPVVSVVLPSNVTRPSITSAPRVGQPLTANAGEWTDATTIVRKWEYEDTTADVPADALLAGTEPLLAGTEYLLTGA